MHENPPSLQDEDHPPRPAEELLPLVYDELRALAASRLAQEAAGHTLQPTALVHEVWLRLAGKNPAAPFANRAHFFAAAAESMRRILIDQARKKAAGKRGGPRLRVDLEKLDLAAGAESEILLMVDEAISRLEREDLQAAQVVKLRFFGGLTLEKAGSVLGITERTAGRHWSYARAWLYAELSRELQE